MKFIKNKIYLLALASLILISCDEDSFLTKENPNAYEASQFYKKAADFNSALATVYGALQFQGVSGGDLVSEMAQSDLTFTFTFSPDRRYQDLTYNDSDASIVNKWNELHTGINRANQVINNLALVGESVFNNPETMASIEAQARCLRAFYYFQLVTTYNTAVLHTEIITDASQAQKELSSRETITQQVIIPDLIFAKENLPKNWDGNNIGRVTSGTAGSLLGKLYLYDKNWPDAATEFKEVIESGAYSLVPNYEDNFTHYNELNSESILETVYSFDLAEGANGNTVDDTPNGSTGAESSELARRVGKNRLGGNANILVSYPYLELLTNDKLANGTQGHSPRLSYTAAPNNFEGLYYGYATANEMASPRFNAAIAAYVKKYSNWYWQPTEIALNRSGINFRHIRYADVLLMYAEALLEGGNTSDQTKINEAITYIDMVRARAGVFTIQDYLDNNSNQFPQLHISRIGEPEGTELPLVSATAANLLTHLQRVERPTELGYEGHRWKDLVRWGIVREVLEDAKAHEFKTVTEFSQSPANRAPLYLRELLRFSRNDDKHFNSAIDKYSTGFDFWPIPNLERQNNNAL
ncbi:RagB/SusD family nutrient uptake outer membrane protein [Postechiella marina]|uniref:RagB/SusD family nutrient uptake outer membrane protein n=1 Tax=Postechiella marina TaxID=943941 RepID=A0ABP8C7E6_9FLAO